MRGGRPQFDAHSVGRVGSRAAVDDGEWHHVAVTFENESKMIRLYVDGTPGGGPRRRRRGPGPAGGRRLALSADVPGYLLKIGFSPRGCFGRHNFDGTVDDVRIYDRILSEEDVKALAEAGGGSVPGRSTR